MEKLEKDCLSLNYKNADGHSDIEVCEAVIRRVWQNYEDNNSIQFCFNRAVELNSNIILQTLKKFSVSDRKRFLMKLEAASSAAILIKISLLLELDIYAQEHEVRKLGEHLSEIRPLSPNRREVLECMMSSVDCYPQLWSMAKTVWRGDSEICGTFIINAIPERFFLEKTDYTSKAIEFIRELSIVTKAYVAGIRAMAKMPDLEEGIVVTTLFKDILFAWHENKTSLDEHLTEIVLELLSNPVLPMFIRGRLINELASLINSSKLNWEKILKKIRYMNWSDKNQKNLLVYALQQMANLKPLGASALAVLKTLEFVGRKSSYDRGKWSWYQSQPDDVQKRVVAAALKVVSQSCMTIKRCDLSMLTLLLRVGCFGSKTQQQEVRGLFKQGLELIQQDAAATYLVPAVIYQLGWKLQDYSAKILDLTKPLMDWLVTCPTKDFEDYRWLARQFGLDPQKFSTPTEDKKEEILKSLRAE